MHEGLKWIEDTNTQTASITKTKAEKSLNVLEKHPKLDALKHE